MLIYNEEAFAEKLTLLNVLLNPYSQWQYTTARKKHEDLFGVPIKEGEVYLKRSCGAAYDDVIKLSRESMDKFIYCLFNGDFFIQGLAEQIQRKNILDMQEQINKVKF